VTNAIPLQTGQIVVKPVDVTTLVDAIKPPPSYIVESAAYDSYKASFSGRLDDGRV
jgi:hypothetical protein